MAAALPSPWPGAYTAPTIKSGVQIGQGVLSGNTTAQLNEIAQVQKGLVWFNPSVAPLLRITSKLKNAKVVENSRFFHLEKQRLPRSSKVAGAVVGGATSPTSFDVTAGNGSRFRVGDLIYNATTGDIALVTAKSTDTLTVTPNIGNSAPSGTLWAATNDLINIGNAYLDGSSEGVAFVVVEDEKTFYCQIFKDAIEMTDRYQKTALYEGDPWTNARKQLEQEHLLGIEHAYFYGKASLTQDASTKKFRTTMAGLKSLANVNVVDFGGDTTITKAFIDSVMNEAMREGHSGFENKEMATKTLFGSHKWLSAFNAVAESQIRIIEPSEKTFGLRIAQYQGSWGVLNLINAPVLNRAPLSKEAFVLDLEHVRGANFKGRDTQFEDNVQTPGTDGKKAQYISDKSLVLEVAPAHTTFIGLG